MPLDLLCSISVFFLEKRLITVVSFSIFFFGGITLPAIEGDDNITCKEYTQDSKLTADCSSQSHPIAVPNNLNPRIQGLNLSNNKITDLNNETFIKYKDSLLLLDVSHGKFSILEGVGSFIPLKNLEYLDISFTCFVNKSVFNFPIFPSSLKIFIMAGCDIYETNFTNLIFLEEFHARSNNFIHFPNINKNAPLKYVDIQSSKLFFLTIPEIAPFCLLKELKLGMNDNDGIQKETKYCECTSLDKWLAYTSVQYTPLNCSLPSPMPTCNQDLEYNKSYSLRQECLGIFPVVKWWWWPFLLLLLILLACCATPYFILMSRKSRYNEEAVEEGWEEAEYEETIQISPEITTTQKIIPTKVTTHTPTSTYPTTSSHPPTTSQLPVTPAQEVIPTQAFTESPFSDCAELDQPFPICPPKE